MRKKSSPAELIVGSSQDMDDDLSDVEEEVFIRDGKSKSRNNSDSSRPLMPSKNKKYKNSKTSQQLKMLKKQYKTSRCWRCLEPFCYALLGISIIVILSVAVLTFFPLQKMKLWFQNTNSDSLYDALVNNVKVDPSNDSNTIERVPCTNLGVTKVWSRTITKLSSEAPVKKADLDGDGFDDIIIGFGVDDNVQYNVFDDIPRCTTSRGQVELCEGGVLAINGASSEILWKFWTSWSIFSLFCKFDINDDKRPDCIIGGPGGLLMAIDGKTGTLLWELKEFNYHESEEIDLNVNVNLYTVNLMRDLDGDGTPDILASHTDEHYGIREGHIRLISGKTGKIVRSIPAPYKEEMFVPIQMIIQKDGTEVLLILTGGQNTAGGVYKILLDSLTNFKNENDYTTVQRSSSGFLVPAILTDLTGDSIHDIIVSSFNSTIYAFNGVTNQLLWNYNFPSSESVSSLVPGNYDSDNVTDVMVKYSTGPGFPIYYYSQTTILNGKTGESFLDNKVTDSGGAHSLLGGISISQSYGGDFFLHFQMHCRGLFENARDAYKFIPDSDIIQQSRADICMLRYNTSTLLKLNAISRHLEPPGSIIFTSDDLSLQLNQSDIGIKATVNQVSSRQPLKHPKMRIKQIQNHFQQQQPPIEVNKKQSNPNQENSFVDNQIAKKQEQQQEQKPLKSVENIESVKVLENIRKTPEVMDNLDAEKQSLKYREKLLSQDLESRRDKMRKHSGGGVLGNFAENGENGENFNDIMSKMAMIQMQRPFKMNPEDILDNNGNIQIPEVPEKSNDYDYYDQSQAGPRYMQAMRRNNPYASNRGVRSDDYDSAPSTYETILNDLEKTVKVDPKSQTVKKVLDSSDVKATQPQQEPRQETLWDIEIEKENNENNKNINRKRRQNDKQLMNQNILPSVSSTGVLVESLTKANSTIDYVFVLNIRESESFPPLLLRTDIDCIEEKMAGLGTFHQTNELMEWQKTYLKECLKKRLIHDHVQAPSPHQTYDMQIIVIRISITCTCNELNPKREVCSQLNPLNEQKWQEYMGKDLDGTFTNI